MGSEDIELFFDVFDIAYFFIFFGGKHDIAAAKVAGTSAKREVKIEGKRAVFVLVLKLRQQGIVVKCFVELQRGGITGIARSRFGVFGKFVKINHGYPVTGSFAEA